jgi:protease-4
VGKQKDTFYSMGKEPDESDLAYVKSLADLMYERMLDGIAESRGVERDTFQPFADGSLGGVRRAMEFGLVDQVGYLEDAVVLAANQGGLDARTADDVKLVEVRNRRFRSYTWAPPGRIAVIEVEGEIVSGESTNDLLFGSRSAGSETITGLLADARRDHAVKAVVLRVDSGGGSSVASDRIWREVKRVRDSGKPVVVSMGDAAASGGYYISMGADYIFANPTTLTGSIGGAWVKTNVTGLEEKAGIERDIVKRGEHVDTFSSTHEWTEDERRMVHQVMEDFQEDFIRRAAEGRGLPIDGMRELAQGQVILGAEAVDLGLVDEIGGLSRALDKAAELAGLGENWEAIFPGDTGAGWDRGGPWWTKLAAGAVRAAGFSRSSSAAGPERPAVRGARSAREVRAARPGAHWRALP